ncbi:MAG: hypothetical protein J0H74_03810 [Chitinophagaceae bacterium]|nr:hypothetical protein [Chitinophagaceae bacterium]
MKSLPPSTPSDPDKSSVPLQPSINPRKDPLTPDKFRELTGNPDLSDEEASERIETTRKLVHIILEVSRIANYCIDNQYVVNLSVAESDAPAIHQIPPITNTKAA